MLRSMSPSSESDEDDARPRTTSPISDEEFQEELARVNQEISPVLRAITRQLPMRGSEETGQKACAALGREDLHRFVLLKNRFPGAIPMETASTLARMNDAGRGAGLIPASSGLVRATRYKPAAARQTPLVKPVALRPLQPPPPEMPDPGKL